MPLYNPPPIDTIGDTTLVTYVNPGSTAADIHRACQSAFSSSNYLQKGTVNLLRGTYTFESPVVVPDHVKVVMDPEAIIIPTFSTGPKDPAGAVFKLSGSIDTSRLNTTLSSTAIKGRNTINLTSTGTLQPGDYVIIEGWNSSGDASAMSDGSGSILQEVIRVSTEWTGSLTVLLAWPLYQQHGGTITVKGVRPSIGAEVHGGILSGSTTSVTSSVGVLVQYALDSVVNNVSACGFSRSAIDVEASVGFKSDGFWNLGGSTSWYFLSSVCSFKITGFDGRDDVSRIHALGDPKAQIYLRRRCTDGLIANGTVRCGYAGIWHGGGHNLKFDNISIVNQEITQAIYDRAVTSGDYQSGGMWAIGFGSGHAPLGIAEFAMGCMYSNINTENLVAPNVTPWNNSTPLRASAVYIHDTRDIAVSNLTCVHNDPNSPVGGIILSDTEGGATNIIVRGHVYGLFCQNVLDDLKIVGYRFIGGRGASPNASIPIYLDYNAASNRGITFTNVHVANAFSFLRFGGSFGFDPNLTIRNLITDSGQWEYCILAYNATGTTFNVGDVVEIDPSNANSDIRIRTPQESSDFHRRLVGIVSGGGEDIGTGYQLVAPLPQDCATIRATGSISYGDSVSYLPTRMVTTVANGSGTLGVSLTRKAAVASGMIRVKQR